MNALSTTDSVRSTVTPRSSTRSKAVIKKNCYRIAVGLLSEMSGILEEIGPTRLPHYTALRRWFVRIPTKMWRAFLGASAEKHTGHAAIDSTGFDRDQPSRHYANCTHYHVRALKFTAPVDVETLSITTSTRPPRRNTTRRSARRSPTFCRATCGVSPLTMATMRKPSATNSAKTASVTDQTPHHEPTRLRSQRPHGP